MSSKQENVALIDKVIGETPLMALERYRRTDPRLNDLPMTYAGRLDPMAEGKLLILVGDKCKEKETYLKLDKEYEVDVVFGIETDSHDALGIPSLCKNENETSIHDIDLFRYVGKFTQEYPIYSSKTVNGKHLHELARTHDLPEVMPSRDVEIYMIEKIYEGFIDSSDLLSLVQKNISLIQGDFRQKEIQNEWVKLLGGCKNKFKVLKIRVSCGSGTYMRSLAYRIGKDAQSCAFAFRIKRTKIYLK
jgi:tRNA pseudouridine(55) synthase